ncbi:HhH-GPD superfamily base excision DNA repair protein [Calycina marina]|uniref:HhH-GPD superfamily base excision DNA repair protein n=1 Tax=Calycina marina TaxID=1763456 RepID=A0A9P7Z332_9HELO|nr:HhH-GPD superfamily base excision DNA repair protein [Calycina marina]
MAFRRSTRIATAPKEDPKPVIEQPTAASKKRKTTPAASSPSNAAPSTPKKARVRAPSAVPAATLAFPTPVSMIVVPFVYRKKEPLTPTPIPRLAASNHSNATLVSPLTKRLVAQKPLTEVLPSKVSTSTTTENILDDAIAHLIKVEPKLKPYIEKTPCDVWSPAGLAQLIDPFKTLASGIISQQVSGAAAKSIKNKFIALFHSPHMTNSLDLDVFPSPTQVAASSVDNLRTAGLSQRKAEYIKGLAEKFRDGELTTEFLSKASYQEVFDALIQVRGLGAWSVEMFACFSLKHLDVFSTGDLGVQKGMAVLKGQDVSKLKSGKGKFKYMPEKEMKEIAETFAPYRSVFMWYTWRVADTNCIVSGSGDEYHFKYPYRPATIIFVLQEFLALQRRTITHLPVTTIPTTTILRTLHGQLQDTANNSELFIAISSLMQAWGVA